MQGKVSAYRFTLEAHSCESEAFSQAQTIPSPLAIARLDESCFHDGLKDSGRSGDAWKSASPKPAVRANGYQSDFGRFLETQAITPPVETHPRGQQEVVNHARKDLTSYGLDCTDVKRLSAMRLFSTQLKPKKEWNVRANPAITESVNPIRRITDALVVDDTNGKHLISLAQGDPAQFGPHMKVPESANVALTNVILEGRNNGYALSSGLLECRRAVAEFLSMDVDLKLAPQDVIMTSGCTQAIQHSIDALRFNGCNMLLPRPGFPLYETLCKYFGVEVRHYDLLQDRDWELNLDQIATLADDMTAALVVCNPGNPSGSVLEHEHLSQIAALAETLKVPIIADEVYARLVFGKKSFVSMAKFASIVPVISVGGVSKNWLAPGWRVGWIGVWDPSGILEKARVVEALAKIMQITLGPSTLMQAAVPKLLQYTPSSFFEEARNSLKLGAELCYTRSNKIQGLDCPTRPQGSMFMMVRMNPAKFKGIANDVEFSAALLKEESVLVLPGSAFGIRNWLRVVFALSLPQLGEAWDRMEAFCSRHSLLN